MQVVRKSAPGRIKYLLYTLIILILLFITSVFLYYRFITKPEPAPEIKSKASLTLDKVNHTATKNGKRQWSLKATEAQYFNGENRALFHDIHVVFFSSDGSNALLTADKGIINTKTNDMEVVSNVIVTKENYRLETEKLSYIHDGRILFTDMPVTIFQGESEIRGDSMRGSLNSGTITLKGNVKGLFSENLQL